MRGGRTMLRLVIAVAGVNAARRAPLGLRMLAKPPASNRRQDDARASLIAPA